ncbi:Ltp family lipoprotein [Lactiplantibacillus paraxiangfangensis]|uniref:Ltp family lipoprotein n=1 Tax=Lactiplantibacillus paraxiangfangensis TaxID=3076224 RepID=UPI0030C70166
MSKKIKGEDGKVYVQKKPFYKRVWFWILVVIVVIGFASSMGGSGSSDSSDDSSATSSKKISKSKESSKKPKTSAQNLAALAKADTYAKTMDMSEKAVYDQLTSDAGEGFSKSAAKYAMDHLNGVNWNKNALKKAESYQKDQSMSTNAIKEQLTSEAGEQFTTAQAQYAVDHLSK